MPPPGRTDRTPPPTRRSPRRHAASPIDVAHHFAAAEQFGTGPHRDPDRHPDAAHRTGGRSPHAAGQDAGYGEGYDEGYDADDAGHGARHGAGHHGGYEAGYDAGFDAEEPATEPGGLPAVGSGPVPTARGHRRRADRYDDGRHDDGRYDRREDERHDADEVDAAAGTGRAARRGARSARPRRPFGALAALAALGTRFLGRGAGHGDGGEPGGHGHGHGHGPAAPAGHRARVLLAALLVPCALAALVGLVLLRPTGAPATTSAAVQQQPVRGDVVAAQTADCTEGDGQGACAEITVHMTDGPKAGEELVSVLPVEPGTPRFAVGDPVVLAWSGGDPEDPASYQVLDFQRGGALGWLAALFAAAVLVLGRWRGLAALGALGVSFAVLLLFVLPAILAGRSPLAVAVVGAAVIMFAVLYLTHGLSARTSTAVVGTLVSLALIGVLAAGFSAAARLTGLDDQTNALITSLGTGVDARGLLLAGIVIGALGVLDDVTVTQTSAVWELHAANPRLGAAGLFRAAMRIGRDHVASAVNTLVLAYAGAALPLLLIFRLSGRTLGEVATSQDVAMEIVRTLVGSIGLVASVPVTTAVAALVASREDPAAGLPGRGEPERGPAGSPRRRARGASARADRAGRGTRAAAPPELPGTGRARRRPATAR